MISILSSAVFSMPKSLERENQDSVLHPKQVNDGYLMAIADGVGGYKGGHEASSAAIMSLSKLTEEIKVDNIGKLFTSIRRDITALSSNDETLLSAATTLTVCHVNSSGLTIGHSGDCRVYIKQNNKLKQITKDHTQHQMLIDDGVFTARQLKNAKGKNIITTALSANIVLDFQALFIPTSELPLENGMLSLFIMSDGSHNIWETRPRFSDNTLSNACRFATSLKKRIELKGPIDDYSLIAVNIKFD
ncbi:PP2C family protein-serine/threonine phosphatase [Citrobacter braakii]|uniref:PP2C family protein-serine/threonine phosphatase n=1 Tax=Citrobacter freundii TaxID=546 RepID=UPI001A277BBB|nr:PP2C family serine/threonine-protein phosphatase [Citrobacter sp.]MDU3460085.1 PP2C family serine/threonine-protein phosphatase [Streptococcus oralis]HAT2813275.1 serine/threonine-protein phosphatase [Citrobacter freundii]